MYDYKAGKFIYDPRSKDEIHEMKEIIKEEGLEGMEKRVQRAIVAAHDHLINHNNKETIKSIKE